MSQLPAARRSAWGDQARQDIESAGGSATSMSCTVGLASVEPVAAGAPKVEVAAGAAP